MTDAIMPDLKQHVLGAAKRVAETKPKDEAEKREDVIHAGQSSHFWQRGLKPYLKKRIEALETLSEVELTGNESLEEVGARFVIASSVGKELQDLINMVEVISEAVQKKHDNDKNKSKA